MFYDDFFRDIQRQHDEMTAPFRHIMQEHEAMVAAWKTTMEPYEQMSRQLQATIDSVGGPSFDYAKMFGDLPSEAGGLSSAVKAFEDAVNRPASFDLPPGFDEASRQYERMQDHLKESFEKPRWEDDNPPRHFETVSETAEEIVRASAARDRRLARLIAEELVQKLREPSVEEVEQEEPAPGKRRIGFGGPEDEE